MVDYSLGERLWEAATSVQPAHVPRPLFHAFPSHHSHSKIVYSDKLYDIVRQFVRDNCALQPSTSVQLESENTTNRKEEEDIVDIINKEVILL